MGTQTLSEFVVHTIPLRRRCGRRLLVTTMEYLIMCSAVATFLREGSCPEAVLFALTFSRVFLCCGAVHRHISPFLGSRGGAAAYPHFEGFIVLDLDVWLFEALHALLVRNFAPSNACVHFFKTQFASLVPFMRGRTSSSVEFARRSCCV